MEGLKRKDRRDKAMVDKISASIILQSFLDKRQGAGSRGQGAGGKRHWSLGARRQEEPRAQEPSAQSPAPYALTIY